MKTLFDIGPVLPAGFSYSPGFITDAEEMQLIKTIAQFDLQNMKFHEYEAKRKVISFGRGWSFTEQRLKEGNPIPGEFDFLVERIAHHLPNTNSIYCTIPDNAIPGRICYKLAPGCPAI